MQGQLASSLGAVDHLAGSFDLIAATGLLVGSLLSDTLFFLKVFIFKVLPLIAVLQGSFLFLLKINRNPV